MTQPAQSSQSRRAWSREEIEMFCSETYGAREWKGFCGCRVEYGSSLRLKVFPCEFTHMVWSLRIGVPIVETLVAKWENAVPPESYRGILAEYLQWGNGCELSFGCEIGSYAQGKAAREFAIKQYVEDYQRKLATGEHLFWGEEFLVGTPMTHKTFEAIYSRDSEPELVQHFLFEEEQHSEKTGTE